MIILNSVGDFKSLYIKTLLDLKKTTYVNLEHAENNNLEYNEKSSSIIYLESPVNDSKRCITKKMSSLLDEHKNENQSHIYTSRKPQNEFLELNKEEVVMRDIFIILRFIQEICPNPPLYDEDSEYYLADKYELHEKEYKVLPEIINIFYQFEKELLNSYGYKNSFSFKKITSRKEIIFTKYTQNKLDIIFNYIKEITQIVNKNFDKTKYFLSNYINSIELIIYCVIKRLFQLKILSYSELNKNVYKKYLIINKIISTVDEEQIILPYQSIDFI